MLGDVAFDSGQEFDDLAEDAALEPAPRQRREEGPDGVEPGAGGVGLSF